MTNDFFITPAGPHLMDGYMCEKFGDSLFNKVIHMKLQIKMYFASILVKNCLNLFDDHTTNITEHRGDGKINRSFDANMRLTRW